MKFVLAACRTFKVMMLKSLRSRCIANEIHSASAVAPTSPDMPLRARTGIMRALNKRKPRHCSHKSRPFPTNPGPALVLELHKVRTTHYEAFSVSDQLY